MSRTFVCGKNALALAWCRREGVHPYAKSTRLISTDRYAGRGCPLRPGDRVVFVGESRFWANLGPAGLGSTVLPERVT